MASSLFARPAPPAKKIRGFLGLSGELRNRIYAYCFEDEFRAELAADTVVFKLPRPKTVKLMVPVRDQQSGPIRKYVYKKVEVTPQTIRISRKLGRYRRVDGLRTKWATSLCPLIAVCKQVHYETIAFLYQNTTFCFQAPRRMTNFLECVSKRNLQLITKLQLHYTCCNEPAMTENKKFKQKHNAAWNKACKSMAQQLTGLKQLKIWMRDDDMRNWSLRHEAVQPLLQFRRLSQQSRRPSSTSSASSSPGQRDNGLSTPTAITTPSRNLQTVIINFTTHDTAPGQWYSIGEIGDLIFELHTLFGKAIAKAILGASEKDAMEEFLERWAENEDWHPYLGYVNLDATG